MKPDELELLEKSDKIILPRIINSSIESIEEVEFISTKSSKSYDLDIKTKTQSGGNSIFVDGLKEIRAFPARELL